MSHKKALCSPEKSCTGVQILTGAGRVHVQGSLKKIGQEPQAFAEDSVKVRRIGPCKYSAASLHSSNDQPRKSWYLSFQQQEIYV